MKKWLIFCLNKIAQDITKRHLEAAKGGTNKDIESIKKRISFINLDEIKEKNNKLLISERKEKKSILRGYPTSVGLATDMMCNIKCFMCQHARLEDTELKSRPAIKEKYLIRFAEQVFPTAKTVALTTAGEPLMSRNFDIELELAEIYKARVEILTNGTLLNVRKHRFKRLVKNSCYVCFSFDSPVKKTYESIRIGADFNQVVENMRLFQKYRYELDEKERPVFNIAMVLMKRNLNEVLQMVKFAKEIGADGLILTPLLITTKEVEAESLDNCKEEFNNVLLSSVELAKKIQLTLQIPPLFAVTSKGQTDETHIDNPQLIRGKRKISRCPFLWERVFIDNRANIVPCCEPSHPMVGSLKDDDFEEIWNGKIYQRMRGTFNGEGFHQLCKDCIEYKYLAKYDSVSKDEF